MSRTSVDRIVRGRKRPSGADDTIGMSISALSSAIGGLSAAQAQFDFAAATAARASLADAADPATVGATDLVGAVVGTTVASQAVAINVAVLDAALEHERSLINILA